jgi:hypothetical protein
MVLDHHPTHETPCCCSATFKALPGNPGSLFSVCNLILIQQERQPQKKLEDDLKKRMDDDLKKLKME